MNISFFEMRRIITDAILAIVEAVLSMLVILGIRNMVLSAYNNTLMGLVIICFVYLIAVKFVWIVAYPYREQDKVLYRIHISDNGFYLVVKLLMTIVVSYFSYYYTTVLLQNELVSAIDIRTFIPDVFMIKSDFTRSYIGATLFAVLLVLNFFTGRSLRKMKGVES